MYPYPAISIVRGSSQYNQTARKQQLLRCYISSVKNDQNQSSVKGKPTSSQLSLLAYNVAEKKSKASSGRVSGFVSDFHLNCSTNVRYYQR